MPWPQALAPASASLTQTPRRRRSCARAHRPKIHRSRTEPRVRHSVGAALDGRICPSSVLGECRRILVKCATAPAFDPATDDWPRRHVWSEAGYGDSIRRVADSGPAAPDAAYLVELRTKLDNRRLTALPLGMSLVELFERFPDEQAAKRWFERLRWPEGERRCFRCEAVGCVHDAPHAKPMPYRCGTC